MTADGSKSNASRVLVVDDDEILGKAIGRALSRAGFEVECAWDGRTAASRLGDARFDLVLSDINMPSMDGLSLLRAVRERDLDVPVVLMTGAPSLESAMRAVEYGAFHYLTKPLEFSELEALARKATHLCRVARMKRAYLVEQGDAWKQPADRVGLDASLDRAFQSLRLVFQPLVRLSSRQIFAFEALVRTDEATLPNPGLLFEAAERMGRRPSLSRAIRRKAAENIGDAPAVFVNVHPRDLLDEDLYDPSSPLSLVATRVTLEITERAALQEVDSLADRMVALRRMGFKIAVDDLGAGYSGLTSFALLEPEVVKVDMSLVRGIDREPTKAKLVAALVALCQDMGRLVVAEGVETPEERDTLVRCGCDVFQGYLFARPGPPFPGINEAGFGASHLEKSTRLQSS